MATSTVFIGVSCDSLPRPPAVAGALPATFGPFLDPRVGPRGRAMTARTLRQARQLPLPHGLRTELQAARAALRGTMKDFTVLTDDPYRMDTPAKHRDAEWFAELIGDRQIHNRGAHYIALGTVKPDGSAYVNDDKN